MRWGRFQVTTGQTVFQGQMLSMQYNTQSHCMPMTAVSGATLMCIGIADANYSTSLATSLATAVYFYDVEARLPVTNVTVGHIGSLVYAAGDASDKVVGFVTLGGPVGRLMELDGTSYAWVWVGADALGA
jgi:hypothetical protein